MYMIEMVCQCMTGLLNCVSCCFQDEARCQLGALQSVLEEMTGERDSAQNHLSQLHNTLQECQEGEPHTHAHGHTHKP
jgi:hypothetical protein